MWRKFVEVLRGLDGTLLALTLSLLAIGLAALYSSSLGRPESSDVFIRQLVSVGVGLVVMLVTAAFDYRIYRSWSRLVYLSALGLLILVLFFGRTIRGTTGWLYIAGTGVQVVEAVKFLWVMALASYLAHVGPPLTWGKTIVSALLAIPLVGLVLAQPDFGSAFLLIVVWAVLLAAVPKPRRWWYVMGGVVIAIGLIGSFFLKDYQRDRLQTFLSPQRDPLGRGYNVTQSVIAVGAGGWWGRGLGLGTQSQLRFLPEQHTDFIFASISEELGLVGAATVLALWAGFFGRVIWLMRRLRDDFAVLVSVGIFAIFASQTVLNIGMNVGLAPVVGVTLPLLSFGGSSLVASLAAVGVLQNLAKHFRSNAPSHALGSIDRSGRSLIY